MQEEYGNEEMAGKGLNFVSLCQLYPLQPFNLLIIDKSFMLYSWAINVSGEEGRVLDQVAAIQKYKLMQTYTIKHSITYHTQLNTHHKTHTIVLLPINPHNHAHN